MGINFELFQGDAIVIYTGGLNDEEIKRLDALIEKLFGVHTDERIVYYDAYTENEFVLFSMNNEIDYDYDRIPTFVPSLEKQKEVFKQNKNLPFTTDYSPFMLELPPFAMLINGNFYKNDNLRESLVGKFTTLLPSETYEIKYFFENKAAVPGKWLAGIYS